MFTIKKATYTGVFPICLFPFRPFLFHPTFLPICPSLSRPLSILPFTILPHCHLAESCFCPLTISPFCQFTLCRFAQYDLVPLSFHPFTTLPNTILPFHHLAPLSFHHSVSVSLKLLTTVHDFLVLEPKQ